MRREIIEVCGHLRRSRLMTPIPAKDCDSHVFNQPTGRSRQVTRRVHQEHPPLPRFRCRRRAAEVRTDSAAQVWQPSCEPAPIAAHEQYVAPRPSRLRLTAEIAFYGLVADKPIRLGKVRQQAGRASASTAPKSSDLKSQISPIDARQPALVIPERDERSYCRAIGTAKRSRNTRLLLRVEINLRRPSHPGNNLQEGSDDAQTPRSVAAPKPARPLADLAFLRRSRALRQNSPVAFMFSN